MADRPKENILYHYTSLTNALNVLNVNNIEPDVTFWASDIGYQNDKSEREGLLRGKANKTAILKSFEVSLNKKSGNNSRINLIRKMFSSRSDFFGFESNSFQTANELSNKFYDDFIGRMENDESKIFTVSLTNQGDDVDQWSRYAQNGFGVAIGFNKDELINRSKDIGIVLGKCEYIDNFLHPKDFVIESEYMDSWLEDPTYPKKLPKHKRLLISEAITYYFIEECIEFFSCCNLSSRENKTLSYLKEEKDKMEEYLTSHCSEDFVFFEKMNPCVITAFLKNIKFKDENEWRLVMEHHKFNQCSFRSNDKRLTPYLEVNLGPAFGLIEEVVIGPSADINLINKSFTRWNYQRSIGFELKKSVIPYRG